jgi:hypothetical protein
MLPSGSCVAAEQEVGSSAVPGRAWPLCSGWCVRPRGRCDGGWLLGGAIVGLVAVGVVVLAPACLLVQCCVDGYAPTGVAIFPGAATLTCYLLAIGLCCRSFVRRSTMCAPPPPALPLSLLLIAIVFACGRWTPPSPTLAVRSPLFLSVAMYR